jgi:hypothetical protein
MAGKITGGTGFYKVCNLQHNASFADEQREYKAL